MHAKKDAGQIGTFPTTFRRLIAARGVFTVLAALAMLSGASTVAQAPAPPILNSPYICPNGLTFTVTTCKPYRADQWCETVEKQNGNLVTTMDSAWTQMTGRLKGCTNAGNSNAASPAPAASAQPASSAQQSFNPPYLKEFPSVDQIMSRLKGSDAQDTAYRQLTALHEFGQIISAMAGPRAAQNQFSPDEIRILTAYFNAYTSLTKSTFNPQDAYAGKPDFTAGLFTTFNMPTIQQLWQNAQKMTANQDSGTTPLPPTNDPSQLAMRRCFELGGTALQCVGTGMSSGFQQMIGINLSALGGSSKSGLTIIGTFKSGSGLMFTFADGNVDIGNCGKMVKGGHDYSVSIAGGKYAINIGNQPQALNIMLGLDGKAIGPAAQDITGQQVTGYEVTTNLKTGAEVGRQPIYGPITVHCTVGALTPGPNVIEDSDTSAGGSSILSALGTVLGSMSGESTPVQPSFPPGPRMAGVFTGAGGLKIQFNDSNAVIDCAQAHVLAQYTVSIQAGAAVAAVKNGTTPFNLSVQSNGSLAGSGNVTVNGKVMTGLNGSDPVFAPANASCPVGTLSAAK
jgi:hypothetical protein